MQFDHHFGKFFFINEDNVRNDSFILFATGDRVYIQRGSANDDSALWCPYDFCGFTGFLMKPTI